MSRHNEGSRKAGLRLDLPAEALKLLKLGATAIVPGSLDDSELIERIFAAEADQARSPPRTGTTRAGFLNPRAFIRAW